MHETIAQLAVSFLIVAIAVFYASTLLGLIPLLAGIVIARWLINVAFKRHECPQTLRKA